MKHDVPASARALLVAAVLAASSLLSACGNASPAEGGESRRILPVAVVHPLGATSYERTRVFTGEIRARRSSVLGFERGGRVMALAIDEGQRVGVNDVIAQLDVASLRAERKRVEAQREEAAATLAEMRAGPRKEAIEAARNRVQELRARTDLLVRKQARRERLLADKHVSREELDETEAALAAMRAQRDAAGNVLAELEAGTRTERIRAQEARVEALDAQLARIDVDLGQGTLRAPFAGRIAARHVDEGAVLSPGLPVVTLLESGHLEAHVGVAPESVAGLRNGQSYAIVIGERSYQAVFKRVLPLTDEITRTRTVILDMPAEANEDIVPGQLAQLSLGESIPARGVWLPSDALVRGTRGLWATYAVDQSKKGAQVVRHHVEVLHVADERALVRGTLTEEALVLVGDTSRVVPGQHVKPVLRQIEPEAQAR